MLQFRLVGTAITRPRRRGPFVCDLPAPDPGDLSRHARDSYRRCQGCRARGLRSTGVSTTGSIHHRCGRVPHYNRALPSLDRVLPSFFTEFFFLSLTASCLEFPSAHGNGSKAARHVSPPHLASLMCFCVSRVVFCTGFYKAYVFLPSSLGTNHRFLPTTIDATGLYQFEFHTETSILPYFTRLHLRML